MQSIRTVISEYNQMINLFMFRHGSNTLTPQTKKVDYSAMKQKNTEIIDEKTCPNQ